MELQNEKTSTSDYLAPGIGELRHRGAQQVDPQSLSGDPADSDILRSTAWRLLPACMIVPALVWWALYYGQRQDWFDLETSSILFPFSVMVVLGLIICLNLKRLSRMDAQRERTEDQLKLAKESAENANRFKSAFFANISHEIRTPLTAINGFAELLLNPTRTPEQRQADAKVIRRNGEHLLNLINDILDLSKIEAGKMSVERIICSPAAIIGEVSAMLCQRAADKGLSLEITFDGQIPTTIRTDPMRLRQVLINLVANAIKFTKEGAINIAVRITPSLRAVEPLLEVKITDTGIGIPAERVASMFEPFVQADASIARQYGGTGLGLAISRHFSRALGGDIVVTSEAGKGSTFTVTVETGTLVDVAIEADPFNAMKLQDNFVGPQVRIKGSILVAEDGLDNQALIGAKLRQTGLIVELAENGEIARDKAMAALQLEKPYDLILMDVNMPVLDGFGATMELRSRGYRGPIIALTANAMERDRSKCLNAGCNDFVTKPIQMDKLFKAIGRYLTIEQAPAESHLIGAGGADDEAKLKEFYDKLTEELVEIAEAIDRQDRVRLAEMLKLVLGKASAVGLKDLAAQAAKLLFSAENEQSWEALRDAVNEFARDAEAKPQRQAA